MYRRLIILLICLLPGFTGVRGQEKLSREAYIEKYAELAMQEMARTGIPASITLAQGCLESDNGNSRLARNGKNHFGIKCHDWTGRKLYHDDDELDECFRKYRSDKESFLDHSDFLTTKDRYAGLFQLKPDDYEAWAKGLKAAGYATSNSYAEHLIRIIEDNELYIYDQRVLSGYHKPPRKLHNPTANPVQRELFTNNGIEYIYVQYGDTYETLRAELDLYPGEIYRYNDLERGALLDSGMLVYLQPKKFRAEKGFDTHLVEEGESMWSISQKYGLKLRRLYRLNYIPPGTEVDSGTLLWLRKRKPEDFEASVQEKPVENGEKVEMEFNDF